MIVDMEFLCAFGWPRVGRVCRVCLFWVVRSEMEKVERAASQQTSAIQLHCNFVSE